MQAIYTKFVGATNSRGSRVIARCDAGRLIHEWDYSLGIDENHEAAAAKLRDRLGWNLDCYGRMVGGCLPNSLGGYAFVFCKG